jgi:hypothetical protein
MPPNQFEALQRQIEQLSLEWKEAMQVIDRKVDLMTTSLASCQSHCHVKKQNLEEAST